jgi:tetratricopeptide (TPR) repeat protein
MNEVATAVPKAAKKNRHPAGSQAGWSDSLLVLALFSFVLPGALFAALMLVRGREFTSAVGAVSVALWIFVNAWDENLILYRADVFGVLVVGAFIFGAGSAVYLLTPLGFGLSYLWGVVGGALSLLLVMAWAELKPINAPKPKRTSLQVQRSKAWIYLVAVLALVVSAVLARKTPNYFRDLGVVFTKKKDFQKVAAVYTGAIQTYPREPDFYKRRGIAYYKLQDYDNAIADFSADIRMRPEDSNASYPNRADCWSLKGEHDKAITDFTSVIRLRAWGQKPYEPYYRRAQEFQALGKYAEALSDFNETLRLWRRTAEPHLARAQCYLLMGNGENAVKDCAMAVDLEPKNVAGYIERGKALSTLGRYHLAIEDFTATLQHATRPGAEDFCRRGVAHDEKGTLTNAAIPAVNAWSTVQAQGRQLLTGPGAFLLGVGQVTFVPEEKNIYDKRDFEKAIDDFTEALRLDPRYVPALLHRAACYAHKGEPDKAIADCTEVIRLDDKNAKAYFHLAQLYQAKGDQDRADKNRARALEIDPTLAAHSTARTPKH